MSDDTHLGHLQKYTVLTAEFKPHGSARFLRSSIHQLLHLSYPTSYSWHPPCSSPSPRYIRATSAPAGVRPPLPSYPHCPHPLDPLRSRSGVPSSHAPSPVSLNPCHVNSFHLQISLNLSLVLSTGFFLSLILYLVVLHNLTLWYIMVYHYNPTYDATVTMREWCRPSHERALDCTFWPGSSPSSVVSPSDPQRSIYFRFIF